ncbi:hypothetical protein [Kribbella sp. CA-294648]|uniref:hypothetical protein n=1 Tax=Kribbella sp. CA-294648 TaxID=3239948 RepID=UPI003D908C3B
MSKLFRRSVLALASVSIPIAVPMSASADLSSATSEADVLYVDSEAFPEGQTGATSKPASFTVTATTKAAKRLELSLDGKALPDRYFSPHGGARARTLFELSPDAGWHQLAMTIVDAKGNRSAVRTYSFGSRQAPASPPGKSATTSASVIGGRFVEADGSPAANLPVAVYPVRMGGHDSTVVALAEATTASDGTWTAEIGTLPESVKKWAADNDGVLNLQAIAEGVARDPKTGQAREMAGVSAFMTGVASAGRMTDAAANAVMSAVPTAPLLPVRRRSELPRSPEVAPPVDAPAAESPKLSAEQASHNKPAYFGAPDVTGRPADTGTAAAKVVGGSDYTAQPVAPATEKEQAALAAAAVGPTVMAADECTIERAIVTKRTRGTVGYTVVLESHAARDVIGGVDYTSVAGSSLSQGISYNVGANWSVNGSVYVGNSFGFTTGFTKGPNWSYQWKVPVAYGFYTMYTCTMIDGVKRLVYRYNAMHAEKVAIPNGGYAGLYGADVSSYDNYYGWRESPYKFGLARGASFSLHDNHTKSTSDSVTAYGFSVTSTTNRSTTRQQRITAGNQSISHTVYGYEPAGQGMKVFYSY